MSKDLGMRTSQTWGQGGVLTKKRQNIRKKPAMTMDWHGGGRSLEAPVRQALDTHTCMFPRHLSS